MADNSNSDVFLILLSEPTLMKADTAAMLASVSLNDFIVSAIAEKIARSVLGLRRGSRDYEN